MKSIGGALVLGTILLGLAGCTTGAAPPPIVVGHVTDKSRLDKAGDEAQLGLRLALHDLSKDEKLAQTFGGRKIVVHHPNGGGDLDNIESQAVRLDTVNRCMALFGGFSADETSALNHAKAPLLTFYGQPVSGSNSQVFYLGMSPARQGAALAKVLAEDAKALRITILLDERKPDAVALAESLQKTLADARKEAKGTSANVATLFTGAIPTWKEVNKRMSGQKPDTVVFAGSVQDFNNWHANLAKDFVQQIVYAGADGDQRRFDPDNDKKSILLASAYFADPASEKITAFAKSFRDSFQTEPDVHAALAYDGLRMLVEAMKRTATQLTPDHVRDELAKTKDFDGLTGMLTITPERQVQRPLFVLRWQNGKTTLVKTIAP